MRLLENTLCLSLRLPEFLHEKIRELAERDNISINQFIATAVAEKAAALLTVDYLQTRGRRAGTKLRTSDFDIAR